MARREKPQGKATRGKTANNRLRRVDRFLHGYDPALIKRVDDAYAQALFVDLGYGRTPVTTLESARWLRRLHPGLGVLGVEIDAERVAAAESARGPGTDFRLGGFNLPLRPGETVRLVRAFNVLRQYDEAEVAGALELLAGQMLPGSLLLEGTSDPYGRYWSANVYRRGQKAGFITEALVFGTSFRAGFDPVAFQAILPKNLIHRVVPGEPIHAFFEAWKRSVAHTAAHSTWGQRQHFTAAGEALAREGYRLNTRRRWLGRGYLIWQDPWGEAGS
ncbi:hypothetical protein ABI59_21325 [Acidobacteria bacterium Mor1]|nr:hypothetical protein ABI59_21325 [Acidobacteria bacterium Mor1]